MTFYVRMHREELTIVDWFILVGEIVLGLSLLARGWSTGSSVHALAGIGWVLAASNYYTARKRFHPEMHQ